MPFSTERNAIDGTLFGWRLASVVLYKIALYFPIEISKPITRAPNLANGTLKIPPPDPTSKIRLPDNGLHDDDIFPFSTDRVSLIQGMRTLFIECKALKIPSSCHQSEWRVENFSASNWSAVVWVFIEREKIRSDLKMPFLNVESETSKKDKTGIHYTPEFELIFWKHRIQIHSFALSNPNTDPENHNYQFQIRIQKNGSDITIIGSKYLAHSCPTSLDPDTKIPLDNSEYQNDWFSIQKMGRILWH
uniref:Uncharacterized protein n=1 Tax=Romanomermis culicivorax TaxID=13658 RepID=A0A915JZ59_ROMCU